MNYATPQTQEAPMSVDARIRELAARHRTLDNAIADALKRPGTDDSQLAEMKKEKLKLKDEIASLAERAQPRF
jgi:hypothetical protein